MIKIKTKAEIELIRQSAQLVSKTLGILAKEVKPGVWVVTLSNGEEFAYSGNNPEWAGLSLDEKNKLLKAQNDEIQKLREAGDFERTFIKEVEKNGVKIRLYEDQFTLSSGKVVMRTFGEGQPPKKDAKKQ